MKVVFTADPAPSVTNGGPTCYSCTADPDVMPGCPRCGGTGTDPDPD